MRPEAGCPVACLGAPLGAGLRPLTLIHTNNSPNPIGMRVSRVFEGLPMNEQKALAREVYGTT